jgi:RNA polymerase sigma factor (sigma-70 family)
VDSGADGRTLAALLPRVRAGDVAAREALARALYDPVRRRVRAEFGRLGEHAVADLTQEAMGRIAAAFPQCRARTDGQLYAWAYRAARSAALNYLAAPRAGADAGARHVALDDGAALGGVADPDAVEELTYRAERGDGLTARGEPALGLVDAGPAARALGSAAAGGASWRTAPHALLQRFAVEAYGELPPPSRELLWRRLVEGAGWEDLGRDLGSSGAAVKRRFERACRRLAHLVTARLVAILGSHAAIPEYLRVHAPPGAGGRSAGRDPAGSGR